MGAERKAAIFFNRSGAARLCARAAILLLPALALPALALPGLCWPTLALSEELTPLPPPDAAARAGQPKISAMAARLEQSDKGAVLTFELSAEARATAYAVAGPDRIIVDLPEVAFLMDPAVGRLVPVGKAAKSDAGLIKSYRFGLFAPGKSRVVIDLARPAMIRRVASMSRDGAPRIEIDLVPADATQFAAAAAEHAKIDPVTTGTTAPAKPATAVAQAEKPLVVIDPGHGGVDVGAAGKHGEQEKAIVFDFARALAAKIEANGKLRVILTRTQDVFISLSERVRFAREHHAALFMSIHADTLGEASVEGATIYTVSNKASDAEAARIAEKENFADQAAGLERKEEAEEIGDILFDLTRRETRAYSRQFAEALVSRWKGAGSLNKNPLRAAGFVVLKAHDVPSVLLELGYLSSEKDLAKLTSPQWRDTASATTAQAIEAFFAARDKQAQQRQQAASATARPQ